MKVPRIINDSGIYLLEIYAAKSFSLSGIFKDILLKRGYYYYTGSAQRNLIKRVERHYRKTKKIHWHIDYITSHPDTTITNSWLLFSKTKEQECAYNCKLLTKFNLIIPVKGFGSSDCRSCESHLLYSPVQLQIP